MSILTDPELIRRFDRAAALSSAGEHQAALEAYEQIFENREGSEKFIASGEFLARVELRKVYCLMDLGRYEDAKALCEGQLEGLAGQFGDEDLYWYYFSYGNVLGNLGQVEQMHQQMNAALGLAINPFDMEKCQMVMKWILHWGKVHQQWEYLLSRSAQVQNFAINRENYYLLAFARESAFFALRGLGRLDEARSVAEELLQIYSQLPEKIQEWQTLLQSVDENPAQPG